jgi:hypothetical protein
MDMGHLVMATHGEDTKGFLALLNEVMWRANYPYHPEYAVYAKGVGHGMIDYMAKVHIPSRLCDLKEELDQVAWGKGTSIDMAIQVAAYHAIAMLREELFILSEPPFQHFPERTEMNGVFKFSMLTEPHTLYEKRMTEFVKC